MKPNIILVIGGCRSGKSSFALEQAEQIHAENTGNDNIKIKKRKIFLATSVPTDAEMEDRVVKHQNERGRDWHTIEEPVQIDKVIHDAGDQDSVILIDCLTLWVSNLLYELKTPEKIEQAICNLEQGLKQPKCPVVLVTNEVGYGIVPENKLARQFRDMAGMVNQRMAQIADTVILTVAGIDVQIKPRI